MKAIILAAGKGTRLQPLTLEIPKAMVQVHGKSLLEHNMEKLLPYIDEFIIVVKYKAEIIKDYFWDEFKWIKITYYTQWDKAGTGWALAGLNVSWECFIIASDTIYRQSDVDMIANTSWYAALAKKVDHPEKYWIFKINEKNTILEVIEKPQEYIWNLASLFYFKVNADLIKYCENLEISSRWEYELTDALNIFVKKYSVQALKIQHGFIDITSMEDLQKANALSKPKLWETQYIENIWDYELHLWIPSTGIQEIVDYSLDESDLALRAGTSDWKKRFISVDNLTSWYEDDNRYPFTLLSKNGIIAGLWWGRPAQAPNISEVLDQENYNILQENTDNTHTSGIRIYPFARGQRLARSFLESCTRYYDTLFSDVHMCIDIDAENTPSIKSFEKLWFQQIWYGKNVNNSPDSGRLRFVYMRISQ